jgi:chemotaxis protein CheX
VKQASSYTIKADFINPFLNSTLSALVDLVAITDVSPTRPLLKTGDRSDGIVSSIIDMSGTPVYGSYAVTFTQPVLDEICAQLFTDELSKGVHPLTVASDFVGEFANIVCGRAKDLLSRRGFCFGLATPRVVSGKDHRIEHAIDGPIIQVPFQSQWGDIYVETSFCHAEHYYAPTASIKPPAREPHRAVA